jgi:hypothetical protein
VRADYNTDIFNKIKEDPLKWARYVYKFYSYTCFTVVPVYCKWRKSTSLFDLKCANTLRE